MRLLKIVTIIGARPQFIKAAALSRAIDLHNTGSVETRVQEVLVHTGQHYDYQMSAVFFEELRLPRPHHNLNVGSAPHGAQTGEMLKRLEPVLQEENPHLVLVYGDTNSTLAGALAAAKLNIPVAHVEAGLRSFNRRMPEEINRVLADHISSSLFCPSQHAVQNLEREGIIDGVHIVGDVMYDVLLTHLSRTPAGSESIVVSDLPPGGYALATVHRAENTDDPERLQSIVTALEHLSGNGLPVVLPLHPRTRQRLASADISTKNLRVIDPVSYGEAIDLEASARVILTDSGGVQKEAYWLGVPCVTMRDETEWVETLAEGWNVLAGWEWKRIVQAAYRTKPTHRQGDLYGDGHAAERIIGVLSVPARMKGSQGSPRT